jgi:hypothetical protein
MFSANLMVEISGIENKLPKRIISMKRSFCLLWMLLILIWAESCGEIIEPSIDKKNVHLLAPGNNYQSANNNVSFWFEAIDGALFYRLQVVSPTFDSIGVLVLDTLINTNKFMYTIEPGKYQWRVRAENNSSKTNFSGANTFFINQQ